MQGSGEPAEAGSVSTFYRRVLDESPVPVADALGRSRLLTVVHGRWTRPVTAVVAGAGFGKTTLLAQAVRENRLVRVGVDVHVRLQAADGSAARLASRLLAHFGAEVPDRADVDALLDCLVDVACAASPTPVCFVLDDVQEVPPGSDGFRLLAGLVDRLPRNAHVLLASRTFPELGVARRAVANEAVVLRDEDLRFTDEEIEAFARARDVPVAQLRPAHGWPALAELLARVPGVTIGEYVWEQVLGPLEPEVLRRVVELAALGGADDDMATAVAGERVTLAALLADVPLVSRSPDGRWELHEVVAESVLARQPADRVAEIRRRGGLHARETGDSDRAVRLLVEAGAWDAVLGTLRGALVSLGPPEDPALAQLWSSLLPSSLDTQPEILLLRMIATSVSDPERSFELGRLTVAAFAERGDVDGEVAALARLAAVAYALVEVERMAPYLARVAELARTGHPWAVAFDAVCRAVVALLSNDWRTAEAILAPVVEPPAEDATLGLAAYFYARSQVAAGHVREASQTIERMPPDHRARVSDGVLGVEFAVAQGLGADDAVVARSRAVLEESINRRPLVARRNARCRLAATLATIGDLDTAREQLIELELLDGPVDITLDEELIARATVAVVGGDEDEAAALAARIPDRGAWFPPVDALVLLYVLRPDLRAAYDALDLDGVHAEKRELARALLAGRADDLEPAGRYAWPRAAVVRWFAPAPWIAEVAIYSAAAGGTPPLDVMGGATAGACQRQVLRRLAGSSRAAVARSARALSLRMPSMSPEPIDVRVLGPLEVNVAGAPSNASELRRERVRSLLGLLVVRRSVSRSDAADLLWPDLPEDAALANLRVTLTHLLKLLEPHRDKDVTPFFVLAEPDQLSLRAGPELRVDAWEFEAAIAEAESLERSGAASLALDAYARAVGYWRGELLSDLGSQEWLDFDRIRLATLFVRGAMRAGELYSAHHDAAAAAAMAERVIAADRWNEAGYRLLISIHLDRGDHSAARRVLGHLDAVLQELGVAPGPETERLRLRCRQSR